MTKGRNNRTGSEAGEPQRWKLGGCPWRRAQEKINQRLRKRREGKVSSGEKSLSRLEGTGAGDHEAVQACGDHRRHSKVLAAERRPWTHTDGVIP